MFIHIFKMAIRSLQKNKIFSFINLSGLAIGLGCCMLILLYSKDELSYDRFHQEKENIYQLVCNRIEKDGQVLKSAIASFVQGPAFKQAIPEIRSFTRVNHKQGLIKKDNETFNEDICWVDENFFSVFSFPLISGNAQQVLAGFNSTVLTAETAEKYFGTTDVVGKTIDLEINGHFQSFTISGVAKKAPENSSIKFSILVPFKYLERSNPDNGWMWFSFPTFFVLQSGSDAKAVAAKMEQVYRLQAKSEIDMNHEAGYDTKFVWNVLPFIKMHLDTEYMGTPEARDPVYTYILGGITLFILLIACINFINLSIAQSLKRSKEIGIRKVVGGMRKQLIFQFLAESMIVCLIAFLFATCFAFFSLPFFNELANKKLSLSYLFDRKLVAELIILYIITVIAAGFYPALVLSGFNPVSVLYGRSRSGNKNYLAKGLVILQFTLATMLIIATFFIYAQFNYLTKSDPGFNAKNLVEFTADKAIMDKALMDRVRTVFSKIAGVEAVAYRNIGKFGGKTRAGGKEFIASYEHIDENYLPALAATVLEGRNFSHDFPSDSDHSVLVNQSFAGQAGWKDPVGKTIDFMNLPGWGSKKITVIGLVKDYHFESLKEKIKPGVFTMEPQLPMGRFIVRIKPTNTPATIHAMDMAYHELFPDHPFQYAFTQDLLEKNYEPESRWKAIIFFSAIVTVFISCIGLFGLSMMSTSRREKEISVRKVLGASTAGVVRLVSRDFIILVIIAVTIAIPPGWWLVSKWLQNFAYRIDMSWWMFALAAILTILMAILTVGFHALKAALANPATSLRNQ